MAWNQPLSDCRRFRFPVHRIHQTECCEVPVLYDHDSVQSSLLPGDLGEGVRSYWGLNGRLDFQIWFKGILTEPLQHFHGFL